MTKTITVIYCRTEASIRYIHVCDCDLHAYVRAGKRDGNLHEALHTYIPTRIQISVFAAG